MRLLRSSLHMLTALASFVAVAFIWCAWDPSSAAAQQSDPVENLRQVLLVNRTPADNAALELRQKTLTDAAANLKSPSDLRLALALPEWQDYFAPKDVAAMEQLIRAGIAKRFEDIVQDTVEKGDSVSREAVAKLLGEMGAGIRAVKPGDNMGFVHSLAPSLIVLTQDTNPQVRWAAGRSLAKINPEPNAAVKALTKMLGSNNERDRRVASEALSDLVRTTYQLEKKVTAQLGAAPKRDDVIRCAAEVVPAGGICLTDTDAVVRRNGCVAIAVAASALNDNIPDPPDATRMPPREGPWTPMQREDVRVYRNQLMADEQLFGPLLQGLKDQGTNIASKLDDASVDVRVAARRALELMSGARARLQRREAGVPYPPEVKDPPKVTEDFLLQAISPSLQRFSLGTTDPDIRVRRATMGFLEALDYEAAPAIPTIVAALRDRDRFIRWAAVRILGKIGPVKSEPAQTKQTIAEIGRLLHDKEDPAIREEAANSLRRFGPDAKIALPALIAMLNVGEAESQEAVIKAIVSIGGPETQDAVRPLMKALDARSPSVRRLAAEALGRMGPLAREAVPELQSRQSDDDATVRTAVAEAILNITRPR